MIKLRITKPKAFLDNTELAIGSTLEFDSDTVPGFLVGKCVVVGDSEGRDLTADNADIDALKKQVADLTADNDLLKSRVAEYEELELMQLQEDYKTAVGYDADKRWGASRLREEIAKKSVKA